MKSRKSFESERGISWLPVVPDLGLHLGFGGREVRLRVCRSSPGSESKFSHIHSRPSRQPYAQAVSWMAWVFIIQDLISVKYWFVPTRPHSQDLYILIHDVVVPLNCLL